MKRLILPFIGPFFAGMGVLGLSGSGVVWNFQGRSLGLPLTALALILLTFGIFLLRPRSKPHTLHIEETSNPEYEHDQSSTSQQVATRAVLTTAESIAQERADLKEPESVSPQVNFAPNILLPGQGIKSRKRKPGVSLKAYKKMADDLFKS